MGQLHFDFDITNLKPANYNPRKISEDSLMTLQKSVNQIGIVKPIIARGNIIVAGHQRCKALLSIGIKKAPVYLLSEQTSLYDEIRFNQLHNGTDLDAGDELIKINKKLDLGFNTISPEDFVVGNKKGKLATVRHEIAILILKYGGWGACVATQDGTVIHAAQYAIACSMVNANLTVYCIDESLKNEAIFYLGKQYGEFCYDGLEKTTYIQTYAQKYRLRGENKGSKSTLYESMVMPWLLKNQLARGLDFGCGQGDYVKRLSQKYNIIGVEFFYRGNGSNKIQTAIVNKMIDQLINSVINNGLFDFIVCDSVLNSVDCLMAEQSVLSILNLLVKQNGKIFFSGRTINSVNSQINQITKTKKGREVEFLDKDGFSAIYRKGHWFYQKFHSKQQVIDLAKKNGMSLDKLDYGNNGFSQSWRCLCTKITNLENDRLLAAIDYEFNLPLPGGKSFNRHNDIKSALCQFYDFNL